MADKQSRYTLNVNGIDHTIRLNDEDAEAHKETFGDSLQPKGAKAKKAPANKAAAEPANK